MIFVQQTVQEILARGLYVAGIAGAVILVLVIFALLMNEVF